MDHKPTAPSKLRFSTTVDSNTDIEDPPRTQQAVTSSADEPDDELFAEYSNMTIGTPTPHHPLGLIDLNDPESIYIAHHKLNPDQCLRLWKILGDGVPLTTIANPHGFLARLPGENHAAPIITVQESEEYQRQTLQVSALASLGSYGILNERAAIALLGHEAYSALTAEDPVIVYALTEQSEEDILPNTALTATTTPRTLKQAISQLALLQSAYLTPSALTTAFDGLNVALHLLDWKTEHLIYDGVSHHPASDRHPSFDEPYHIDTERTVPHVASTCKFHEEFWGCIPTLEQLQGVEWEEIEELRYAVANTDRDWDHLCDICRGRVQEVVLRAGMPERGEDEVPEP